MLLLLLSEQLHKISHKHLTKNLLCHYSFCINYYLYLNPFRSLVLFSSVTRIVNARYLVKFKHLTRILGICMIMASGFFILSLALSYNEYRVSFYLSLFSAVIVGVSCALGESTILGFLKDFPSNFVGYFSSGTGFAGIFGIGFLLLM